MAVQHADGQGFLSRPVTLGTAQTEKCQILNHEVTKRSIRLDGQEEI